MPIMKRMKWSLCPVFKAKDSQAYHRKQKKGCCNSIQSQFMENNYQHYHANHEYQEPGYVDRDGITDNYSHNERNQYH